MKVKEFIRTHTKGIVIAGIVLLIAVLWLGGWARVSRNVERAAYEESFRQLTFDGAYYVQFDAETVGKYISGVTAVYS